MTQLSDHEQKSARPATGPVLQAADAFDLAVLSARFQDALIRGVDLGFDRGAKRFALVANRYMHERPPGFWAKTFGLPGWRCRAGLHFNGVLKVESRDMPDRQDVDTVLSLLALEFTPCAPGGTGPEPSVDLEPDLEEGQTPGRVALHGEVLLTFAGGPLVRLTVEALDAEARDLSAPWRAGRAPRHRL